VGLTSPPAKAISEAHVILHNLANWFPYVPVTKAPSNTRTPNTPSRDP
jgi:hypothetical protein